MPIPDSLAWMESTDAKLVRAREHLKVFESERLFGKDASDIHSKDERRTDAALAGLLRGGSVSAYPAERHNW